MTEKLSRSKQFVSNWGNLEKSFVPNVGIGTTSSNGKLEVLETSVSDPFRGIIETQIGAISSEILLRRANGTLGSPTAINNGDAIASIKGTGYGATGWASSSQSTAIGINATENWSDTAQGSAIVMGTVPNGNVTKIERLRIDNTGNVGIGLTAPAYKLDVNGVTSMVANSTNDLASFRDYTTGKGLVVGYNVNSAGNAVRAAYVSTEAPADLALGNGTYPQVMTIANANGFVGIGSATPTVPLDVNGVVQVKGQMYSESNTVTWAATTAINFNLSNTQTVTLGGTTTFTFSNGKGGAIYTLILKQDATGSRTVTWPATAKWPGGVAPTLTSTANAVDVFTFVSDGTNYYNLGFASDVK